MSWGIDAWNWNLFSSAFGQMVQNMIDEDDMYRYFKLHNILCINLNAYNFQLIKKSIWYVHIITL
jgi:hypothetical protein